MAKYPGSFIINEVGTRKELAGLYGVSERTIYRWLNKAAKESGLTPKPKKSMPAPKALAAFKGTRKQLATKYGISERTAYRWLAKARSSGMLPEGNTNRATTSKYPGINILSVPGKNKELAEQFGVSDRTISRWKRKAKLETGELKPELKITKPEPEKPAVKTTTFEEFTEEAYRPENLIEPPEIEQPEPVFEEPVEGEDIGEPWEVPETLAPEFEDLGLSPETIDDLQTISNIIIDNDLLLEDSLFTSLSDTDKVIYLSAYIDYQLEKNPYLFYNKKSGEIVDTSPEHLMELDIWGSEFESFMQDYQDSSMYEV